MGLCDHESMGAVGLPLFPPARTPRSLWIELTSKCPFDCVFCSRKTRRGSGQHLPFPIYEKLIAQLVDPRTLVLNYSGESTVYPDLIPAIRLARSAGAHVELVSAMAAVPESMLEPLSCSGLNRLTVSVHAADAENYADIYRYSSFQTLRARLEGFLELCRAVPDPPIVDFSFVAMDRNLTQLPRVADFAGALGLHEILIFPVMRRDEIPVQFSRELTGAGEHLPEFETRVRAVVEQARGEHSDIRFTVCNPSFTSDEACLGEVPGPYPGVLPADACVHSCEQNPFETAHVLANGDVVVCEVLDRTPLGNLQEQSLAEIWEGEAYRRFRERYHSGTVPECRSCTWKKAYRPGPLRSEVLGARGRSAQLVHGWHDPSGEPHVWSSQQASAILAPLAGSRTVHVSGMLPPGLNGERNVLTVRCNGKEIGTVENRRQELLPFGVDFSAGDGEPGPWSFEFRTSQVYRPRERGLGTDQRDLGFALVLLASKAYIDRAAVERRRETLEPLVRTIHRIDEWGRGLRRFARRSGVNGAGRFTPGISILIPERDNAGELAACLESVAKAAVRIDEPVEIVVVVNGSACTGYDDLRQAHPSVNWQFHEQALGFSGAISAGLRGIHYDWVYLLNNDVVLDGGALRALAACREASIFSISSQVFLKDSTRFREETNWATLFLEDGLATIHDWIPRSDQTVETFYSGGGASLFQTRLLKRLIDSTAYAPFYWEDVEWGWRARKLGYRSLFCPDSIVQHRQHATIGRCYRAPEVETILQRNRLLFQLRNFTSTGSVERVMDAIAQCPEAVAKDFVTPRTRWQIARGRLWNHLAPASDEAVMAAWDRVNR